MHRSKKFGGNTRLSTLWSWCAKKSFSVVKVSIWSSNDWILHSCYKIRHFDINCITKIQPSQPNLEKKHCKIIADVLNYSQLTNSSRSFSRSATFSVTSSSILAMQEKSILSETGIVCWLKSLYKRNKSGGFGTLSPTSSQSSKSWKSKESLNDWVYQHFIRV